jgi:hypothetical protein
MSEKLERAMLTVFGYMYRIEREVFKPGMKMTFIARDPTNPEADFLLSEDDLSEVAELLIRSSKREQLAP